MSVLKALHIFIIVSCCALPFISCAKATDDTAANNNTTNQQPKKSPANESIDELALIIKFPFEVDEASWIETPANGETAQKLTAVLRFTTADSTKLVAELSKSGEPTAVTMQIQDWFPTELITKDEMTGSEGLSGKSYSAEVFFQPLYNSGKVVHIDETDIFIVELTVK